MQRSSSFWKSFIKLEHEVLQDATSTIKNITLGWVYMRNPRRHQLWWFRCQQSNFTHYYVDAHFGRFEVEVWEECKVVLEGIWRFWLRYQKKTKENYVSWCKPYPNSFTWAIVFLNHMISLEGLIEVNHLAWTSTFIFTCYNVGFSSSRTWNQWWFWVVFCKSSIWGEKLG